MSARYPVPRALIYPGFNEDDFYVYTRSLANLIKNMIKEEILTPLEVNKEADIARFRGTSQANYFEQRVRDRYDEHQAIILRGLNLAFHQVINAIFDPSEELIPYEERLSNEELLPYVESSPRLIDSDDSVSTGSDESETQNPPIIDLTQSTIKCIGCREDLEGRIMFSFRRCGCVRKFALLHHDDDKPDTRVDHLQ